jgi:hypothetical protein
MKRGITSKPLRHAKRLAAMKTSLVLAVALLAGAGNAWSADGSAVGTAARIAQAALDDKTPYEVVESLTSEVGQRLAGTEAHARAVTWAEAKLTSMGFANVHAESFAITAWIRGAETAQITAPAPQQLAVTALGGSVATDPAGIEAEIALFRTYAELLAASPGSLAGKIAVVTQRMVRVEDGGGYGAANPIRRAGPSEAARRGAVAYLLRSLGTDSHRLPHTGALNYQDGAPRIPAAALSIPDADQLERLAARGAVRVRLVLTPITRENAPSWNVVGEVKGRERPDEIVLIGAHLDSWDLATGATDDGAGVAIVTSVGKALAALPSHPRRTVRVVLFGAEEMDYSGPAYAAAHADETAHIVLAAEADFGARNAYAVQLPPGAADGDFARMLGQAIAPLGAFVDRRPALAGGDDVRGLQKAGVPVASVRQNGFDYFDTHHTADDTLDKIDPRQLSQAASVWSAFIYLAVETDVDFRKLAAAPPR